MHRYVGGKPIEQMRFPRGGHGDELSVVRRNSKVLIHFNHTSGTIEIPWQAGASISVAQAKSFKVTGKPAPKPAFADWLQGRVFMPDASEWRLYGVPFHPPPRLNGDNPNIPGRLEHIVSAKVARTIDVRDLGRDPLTPQGNPIDLRLEPEGLSLITLDGSRRIMIGVVTGSVGKAHKIQLYTASMVELEAK